MMWGNSREYNDSIQNSDPNQSKKYVWNPFAPTPRDLERTEELANQSVILIAFLSIVHPLLSMVCLRRGANAMKIFVYVVCVGLTVAVTDVTRQDPEEVGQGTAGVATLMMGLEQVVAVSAARGRQRKLQS